MTEARETTSLLIVEEQDLLRQGLESIFKGELDIDVVGSTGSAFEGIQEAERLQPQVVVLGLNDGPDDGADVCAALVKKDPDAKILLLAPRSAEQDVIKALKHGASGCLLTDVVAADLIQTIRLVARGQMVVPQTMANKGLVERRKKPRRLSNVSIRELEVLQLMAGGLRNKEIAAELCISDVTVKTHVSRILRKLGKTNRTAAILHAHQAGWVTLSPPQNVKPA